MPWLSIENNGVKSIRFYPSLESAYLDHFNQKKWSIKIKEIKIKPLDSKQLISFLSELLKGLEAGLKLQEVLTYLSHNHKKTKVSLVAHAINDEISMGVPFNTCFKALVEVSLHGYCDLFIQNSTSEQLIQNLSLLHEQIAQLRSWIKRLQKSLIYPYFVIQLSLIIWLASSFLNAVELISLLPSISLYVSITCTQFIVFLLFQSSLMINLTENYYQAFRLNKLFSLLKASLSTGNHLQNALTLLPKNFSNPKLKDELLLTYYHLRLGDSYLESFPTYWFPKESLLALEASCHSGDIIRAIESATHIHHQRWQASLAIVEKLCPIIGLIIAAIFVSKTLTSIYLPLINIG
ncbi:hypothetical protein TW85_14125 [Marinomonas sp. S3726]|uniref:type II secretion system F family protein n=1 Tax=Marinomonas sp. S3726 TaxID=579484 RepID=UPI0005FA08FE|nr:type II secretion system F family protein [Marinomonas sp. S3726]KJZ12888.1 hypothetical protein TW85_14125 [Marinomonas sp. S3726]